MERRTNANTWLLYLANGMLAVLLFIGQRAATEVIETSKSVVAITQRITAIESMLNNVALAADVEARQQNTNIRIEQIKVSVADIWQRLIELEKRVVRR